MQPDGQLLNPIGQVPVVPPPASANPVTPVMPAMPQVGAHIDSVINPPSAPMPPPAPMPPAMPTPPAPAEIASAINDIAPPSPTPLSPIPPPPTPSGDPAKDDLLSIKHQALQNLTPLLSHIDQTPDEKFKTTMMMIQATDNPQLLHDAFAVANQIQDEKSRAQALLDIVNEINYFTHQHPAENPPEIL
jgi:hypothetical protein